MIANRLTQGDEIRIIAPSTSMAIIKQKQLDIATERLASLGFRVSYGRYADEHDEFFSSSIEKRISDLHEAFREPQVKAVLTAIGGYNANQLLSYIDFDLIKSNPKIFC